MVNEINYSGYLASRRPCVICNSEQFSLWCQDEPFDFLKCQDCGLVLGNPCLNDKGLSMVYQGHHQSRIVDEDACKKRDEMYLIDRDFLLDTISGGVILDVGCGGGFFLNNFDPAKWNRHGLEIDPDTAPYARKHFNIDVHIGTSESMPFESPMFDVVIFRGSFEHLVNPHITAGEVYRVLKPGGYLYLCATPNVDAFCANLYRQKWNQFDAKEHIFLFSVTTLKQLLSPCQFRHVKSGYFYEETPYCDIINDMQQVISDYRRIQQGRFDEVGISPAFWGNMMNVIFRKPWNV